MRRIAILIFALALCSAPALAAFDQDDPGLEALALQQMVQVQDVPFAGGYENLNGYDWPKDHAFRSAYATALNQGLPANVLAARPWIPTISGVTSPGELVRLNGKTYFYRSFCQQHNCGGNQVFIVYQLSNKQLWGVITSFSPTQAFAFGKPRADQAALLLLLLSRDVGAMLIPLNKKDSTPTTFPLDPQVATNTRAYLAKSRGNLTFAAADMISEQMGN